MVLFFYFAYLSLSLVSTPHQLLSQCREISLVPLLYYFNGMWCLTDNQLGLLCHSFASSVNSNEIIMASAFYIQHDLCRIIDDNRTDIQTVRSNRSQTETTTLRNDNRSTIERLYAVEPVGVVTIRPSA